MAKKVMVLCVAMAILSAIVYILMANGIWLPESLDEGEPLPVYFYVVPAGYIIGGLLILLKRRWIWIAGAVINAFTIFIFYTMYAGQPDVMLSTAGLTTKIAQAILEIGLIYLIVTFKKKGRPGL